MSGDGAGTRRPRAVIDIGTNSVRLLVADTVGDAIEPIVQRLRMPRLGQGVDRSRRLSPEAMERTAAAIGELVAEARAAGAKSVKVVGTSALRDAANRQEFVDLVRKEHGLHVAVLSGHEEAALSFRGAVLGLSVLAGRSNPGAAKAGILHDLLRDFVCVLDVGGGSTELTCGTVAGDVLGRSSVDVGAVRMTEQCIASDPPTDSDWKRLGYAVARGLQPFWKQRPEQPLEQPPAQQLEQSPAQRLEQWPAQQPKRPPGQPSIASSGASRFDAEPPLLIAVGGTATALAAIDLGLPEYDSRKVHGHVLTAAAVAALLARLGRCTAAERAALPAMQPERADIIVAGTFIVNRVMEELGAERLIVSEADLLAGVLLKS